MSKAEIKDCLNAPIRPGMQAAAATLSHGYASLRIGVVEKNHASGALTLRLRDGSAGVVRNGSNVAVVQGFGSHGRG